MYTCSAARGEAAEQKTVPKIRNKYFSEVKLRGLVPSFHIHVSVSDFYIPWIGPPLLLQKNRQTDPENI
jgi:hypothetical protein